MKDNVERVVQSETTKEEFVERYEKQCKPCVLVGTQESWQAARKWTVEVCKPSLPTVPLNIHSFKKPDLLHLLQTLRDHE